MTTRNIVLVTIDYPPEHGGVARYLRSLVEASEGRVHVIIPIDSGFQDHGEHSRAHGNGVQHAFFFRRKWPTWWPIVALCRKQKNAILLISHVFPVGTAACISRFFGGPEYVVIFHGLDLRRVKGLWKTFLLRVICGSAKSLVVNSQSTASDLRKYVPGAKCTMMTPGVELKERLSKKEARHALGLDPEKQLVVSLARLVSRKGIDVALDAMSQIQKEGDVDYVILGDGPERSRLEKLALRVGTTTRWVISPTEEEKWKWLAAADLFVLPVRDEGNDVEGFGIVFLEAASVGVPSVAGKSGGAVEAVIDGKTGLLVDPTSPHDIQKAIEEILGDTEMRQKMGAAAKGRVERDFRWSQRWDKLKDILK